MWPACAKASNAPAAPIRRCAALAFPVMRGDRRRVLVCAAGVAALFLAQGLLWHHQDLLLHFAPLLAVLVLLLQGGYVGESRIVAARERALPRPRVRRRARQRWRPA